MQDDPYTRRGFREVYRNPWLAVEAHDIVHPNGVPGEHLLVVTLGASAVVVEDGDALIFANQARFGARTHVVELVKGGRDKGETGLDCAKRELREELGLEAREWASLGRLYEIPSIMSYAIELYLARDLLRVDPDPEHHESVEPTRLGIAEAIEAAATGAIDDAVTVAALFRYVKDRGGFASGLGTRTTPHNL